VTPIIFDAETAPLVDVEQYLGTREEPEPPAPITPPDLDAIRAPSNWVDEEKIAANIEKQQRAAIQAHTTAVLEQAVKWQETLAKLEAKWQAEIASCALHADLGRFVAVGWMFADDPKPRVITCKNETDEKFALEQFWRDYTTATNPQLVTYNGLSFDLPYLMRRSLFLGIRYPSLNLDRYRTPHLDLMQHLSFNGVLTRRSLKFYLNRFNIPNEDSTTGKEIGAMVKAGDWAGVSAHCAADVIGTKQLAQRLGLIERTAPQVAEGAF
jgi:predicted PolB exonuclease-like 3'-5' exonuclease